MATGEDNGTWGVKTNNNLAIIDSGMGGRANANLAGASGGITVSTGASQCLMQVLTGALAGNVTYTFPAVGSFYIVNNQTTGFTLTVAMAGGGATYAVPTGQTVLVFVNPDSTTGIMALSAQAGLTGAQYQMVRFNASAQLAAENAPYDLCFSTDDGTLYTANQTIVRHAPVHPLLLPASLTGSRAGCAVAPTGSITVALNKNGAGIGTINIAAGATSGTFTFASPASFTVSDVLTIVAPAVADATLAGVFASLQGIRQ